MPVPPGFVVTADTYFRFIDHSGLEPAIRKELFGLDVHNSRDLNERASRIRARLMKHQCRPTSRKQSARDTANSGRGLLLPVSSATAEDLPEASFAGQQSTYLNVVGEENVVRAVQACWASLWEGRAIFYREESGYDHIRRSASPCPYSEWCSPRSPASCSPLSR
ncbi:MAG: PEP/pyruvate-binding domain-containing protein [Dehalococcoidia bacterium]